MSCSAEEQIKGIRGLCLQGLLLISTPVTALQKQPLGTCAFG